MDELTYSSVSSKPKPNSHSRTCVAQTLQDPTLEDWESSEQLTVQNLDDSMKINKTS